MAHKTCGFPPKRRKTVGKFSSVYIGSGEAVIFFDASKKKVKCATEVTA
jgi:hypothetical protein